MSEVSFILTPYSVDDTGSDSAGGLMREAVPTTNEALALAIFRSIQDHDIGYVCVI